MIKIALFLFVFIIPVLGLSQSARKINKALKGDYAVQFERYDSLMHISDSITPLYQQLKMEISDTVRKLENQRNTIMGVLIKIMKVHEELTKLEVADPFDSSMFNIIRVKPPQYFISWDCYLPTRSNTQQFLIGSFDKMSIRDQNKKLDTVISKLVFINQKITETNDQKIKRFPLLNIIKQNYANLGVSLDSTFSVYTNKLVYLIEQKEQAKYTFRTKGPSGFNLFYFSEFPEEFPHLSKYRHNYANYDMELDKPKEMEIIIEKKESEVYTYVDETAAFKGNLKQYLDENIVYPQRAVQLEIEGRCYLQFIVSDSGNISNIKVKRGVPDCPECDEEAVRVVKGMPNWIPAEIGGKPVNSTFNLPVSFKLPTQ